MDSEVDVIGIGGAGGFLASSLYQGGIRPRINGDSYPQWDF